MIVVSRKKSSGKKFAKRSLGQNFLADGNYVSKITDQLGETGDSLVIEIGPGRGALTDEIAKHAKRLVAIELDRDLAEMLRNRYVDCKNVEILEADILAVNFEEIVLTGGNFTSAKFIGNLPYNISTPFLQRLTDSPGVISEAVLMLQKEVVSRITAEPGSSERGFITVLLEAVFRTDKLFDVPPQVFRPVPKVWSSVIRMRPKAGSDIFDRHLFRQLVSYGFRQKRKTILNNLKSANGSIDWHQILKNSGIPEKLRPEGLDVAQWILLANALDPETFQV